MSFATHHPAAAGPSRSRRTVTRRFRPRVLAIAGSALHEIFLYLAGSERSRIRQRERLGELDDRMLGDIGLARRERRRGERWI
jgi:uncharacterized protein YjiS (DUF1127 family)